MSCIIKASTKVNIGMKIINHYTDKTSSSTTLFIGDVVDKLEYTEDSQTNIVSGQITNIDTNLLSVSQNFDITQDMKIGFISITSSTVPVEITEIYSDTIKSYAVETGKEVESVSVVPIMKVDFSSTLSDGRTNSETFEQGHELKNVQIQKPDSVTKGDFVIKAFMYKINKVNYHYNTPVVYGMLLSGETEERVMFENIKSCGAEGIEVESDEDINDVIASITDTDAVDLLLPIADFPEALTINKNVNLIGNNENVSAATGDRATDEIDDTETVLLNTITCERDTNVVFKGLAFTDNVYIIPNGATSITFKNCKFVETEPDGVKSYLFKDRTFRTEDDSSLLLQFEGCYFGPNTASGDNKMYNLLEIHSRLADGSYIKNCYFAKGCSVNNVINLYDVDDNATIEISGNHFEYSGNAVRVGFRNHPKCRVIIKDNTYDETDSREQWTGFLIVQPYGTLTETFEDVTIDLYNNKYLNGECRDGYLFFNESDTNITPETAPVVNTDGYFDFGFE